MLDVFVCQECLDEVYAYGTLIESMYGDICQKYAETGRAIILSPHAGTESIIKFLEIKGFLVSIDDENGTVFVCPCGVKYRQDDYGELYTFCSDRKKHDNAFDSN